METIHQTTVNEGIYHPLHVVCMPEPTNCGEDLNWIKWMVIGHSVEEAVSKDQLNDLVKDFFKNPALDSMSDEWQDFEQDEITAMFLNFAADNGYTIFRPTRIQWCSL